tara:strand:- start:236 stop:409 length:174 start_codon:yes stop_codon:yes gene_type:complete
VVVNFATGMIVPVYYINFIVVIAIYTEFIVVVIINTVARFCSECVQKFSVVGFRERV